MLRFLVGLLVSALGFGAALRAQSVTGSIEGRVSNPATGEYLERAQVTVEGTTLETFTDADGFYRLTDVPAGTARVKTFYTGLLPQSAAIAVVAGGTASHHVALISVVRRAGDMPDGAPIKLDEFVVSASREMSGAAIAINEQRFASNIKDVIATDEFGEVAEGNVAEFVKFLPGVTIDYAGSNARGVSLNGVPADNVPVSLGGFDLASAVGGGQGGTNRAVALDQVSINNVSRIEVSFSPTPESSGMALAAVRSTWFRAARSNVPARSSTAAST
jgi:hypothetical protein